MSLITTLGTKAATVAEVAPTQSVQFNGVDEYITMGNVLNITDHMSISFWVKSAPDADYENIMGKYDRDGTTNGWLVQTGNSGGTGRDNLRFIVYNNGGTSSYSYTTDSPLDGSWHHVVWSFDASAAPDIAYWLDGSAGSLTTSTQGASAIGNTDSVVEPFLLGNSDLALPFTAMNMMYVAVFDTEVLGSADVAALYNGGVPKDPSTITYSGSQNLRAWWKLANGDNLETASGVIDQTGNGLHGSGNNLTNSTDLVTDVPPRYTDFFSYDFDGTADYINFGNVTSFDRTDAWSFAGWVKADAVSLTYTLLAKVEGAPNYTGWNILLTSNIFSMNMLSDLTYYFQVNSSTAITANNWHFLVATMDGTATAAGVTLYQNGSVLGKTVVRDTLTQGSTLNTVDLQMGARFPTPTSFFDGHQSFFALFNKELSGTEVTELYNGGVPTDPTQSTVSANVVAFWPLGEGADTLDSASGVLDRSGNAYHGTAVSMTDAANKTTDVP